MIDGNTGELGCVAGCHVSSKSIECALQPFRNADNANVVLSPFVPQILMFPCKEVLSFATCRKVFEMSVCAPRMLFPKQSRIIRLLLCLATLGMSSNLVRVTKSAISDVSGA